MATTTRDSPQKGTLDQLRDIEKKLTDGPTSMEIGPSSAPSPAALVAERGANRLEGFADAALADLTGPDVLKLGSSDPFVAAQTGEAYRIKVRDELLFKAKSGQEILDTLKLAEEALQSALKQSSANPNLVPWIHAHLGATYATRFWMEFSVPSDDATAPGATASDRMAKTRTKADEAFAQADAAFIEAERLSPAPYPWCFRFHAFLFALRGKPGDFRTAADYLARARGAPAPEPQRAAQSSISRSLAMLIGLEADPRVSNDGVEAALNALKADSEDHVAAHALALNIWQLLQAAKAQGNAAEAAFLRPLLKAAIKGAKLRARNARNRAEVELNSLELMREDEVDPNDAAKVNETRAKAIAKAQNLLAGFVTPGNRLDIEALSLLRLDPVLKLRRGQAPYAFLNPAHDGLYDRLRDEPQGG